MIEREAVNAELGRTRTFLDNIIEHMPAILSVKDARRETYLLVNRAASALFGIPPEKMIGRNAYQLFSKEQAEYFAARDREATEQRGIAVVHEHVVASPQAGQRTLNTTKLTIPDARRRAAVSPELFRGHHRPQARRSADRPHGAS